MYSRKRLPFNPCTKLAFSGTIGTNDDNRIALSRMCNISIICIRKKISKCHEFSLSVYSRAISLGIFLKVILCFASSSVGMVHRSA